MSCGFGNWIQCYWHKLRLIVLAKWQKKNIQCWRTLWKASLIFEGISWLKLPTLSSSPDLKTLLKMKMPFSCMDFENILKILIVLYNIRGFQHVCYLDRGWPFTIGYVTHTWWVFFWVLACVSLTYILLQIVKRDCFELLFVLLTLVLG